MATSRDAHASKNITVVKLEDHKTSTENQVEEEQSESYMTKDDYDDHRDEVVAQNSDDMNGQNSKVCEHCGEVILISNKLNGHKMSRRQSIVIFKMNHKCQVTVMKKRKEKVARFLPKWLNITMQEVLLSTLLAPDPVNTSRATCTMCPNNPTFSINDGRKAIKQHYKTAKHQESFRNLT